MIIGIDEVGRGAWAGPLVVAAVAIQPNVVDGLADSKVLSKKRRQLLAGFIRIHAEWIGIGWVTAKRIDVIGMSAALKLAASKAMVGAPGNLEVIIDGTIRLIDEPRVTTLAKADQLIPAVSAASIIAKVARDSYMESLEVVFPGYAFSRHVGYGTALHRRVLADLGPMPLHRMSFSPLARFGENNNDWRVKTAAPMETNGAKAEQAALDYLCMHGYELIDRNWKTKLCEIDLIVHRGDRIYFVEVKYRRVSGAGSGFDYVTATKQRQMKFAASSWVAAKQWRGPVSLAAVQVSGDDFEISGFTTEIFSDEAVRARTTRFD